MTMGDKIIKIERILDYLLKEHLYDMYKEHLKDKAKSIPNVWFFENPEDWEVFYKVHKKDILKGRK